MAKEARKSQLIGELARARAELTTHALAAKRQLDFGARLKASVRRHPLPWFGGAALLGLLLTWPRRRKKVVVKPVLWRKETPEKKVVKAGLALTVFKLIFDIFRPALTKWVTKRVTNYASDRFRRRA